jgi:hypothetical protein
MAETESNATEWLSQPRTLIAQSLYAVGAALRFIHPWVSIAATVLVQLNYAVALRAWWRKGG